MKYTLVLDLDETLIHYSDQNDRVGELRIRPGAEDFLRVLSLYYEIVIFTAGTQEYADWALSHLQSSEFISHRLYRQHTIMVGSRLSIQIIQDDSEVARIKRYNVKDLSRIGRDLTKTIIIDNIAENFQFQPDNGIFIKSWFEDEDDTALYELTPLLIAIVDSG